MPCLLALLAGPLLPAYAASGNGRTAPPAASGGDRDAGVAVDLVNGGFETGDFTGWFFEVADAAVVPSSPPSPCFQGQMPSEGTFMACLSTGTVFGGAAAGTCTEPPSPPSQPCGSPTTVRSDLTSDPILFDFRPDRIRVDFTVDFQTSEPLATIGHDDAFQARLITAAGTFVMLQIDGFGPTPSGSGLQVQGFGGFSDTLSTCQITGKRTRRLKVRWKKTLDPVLKAAIGLAPVHIEFSISNQGDAERASIVCIDDVQVTIRKLN